MNASAFGNEVVPFGKYKGQPTELLLADRSYCEWLAAQPWFQDRYPKVYNVIINGPSSEEQCTPEHNAMQNLFLLDRYPHAAKLATLLKKTYAFERKGEVGGWDVVLNVEERQCGWISVELKPSLGDDYPAVLRKMLQRLQTTLRNNFVCDVYFECCYPVLVIGNFHSEVTTLEDLKAIFAQHGITVVTLAEVEATSTKKAAN